MTTELVHSKGGLPLTTDNLALFVTGSLELLELLQFREDTCADPDLTATEVTETLKACDASIETYVRAQVERVDDVAAYLREFEARIAALVVEKERLSERIDQWQARCDRVEQIIKQVMQSLGKKKLEGASATFTLKKNPPSAEVAQPDLVPSQYKRMTLTISVALFERLLKALSRDDASATVLAEIMQAKRTEPEVSKSTILAELKNDGSVPGARLITDKVHLEVK